MTEIEKMTPKQVVNLLDYYIKYHLKAEDIKAVPELEDYLKVHPEMMSRFSS